MNRTFRLIKNSLQARISLAVIAVSLLLAVIAGGFSFYTTYHETEELQDDLLRQTAALSSSDEDETDIDSDARIFTQRPGKQGRLNIPADLSDGFHDLRDDGDDYRIYLHHGSHGPIAVIQENEYRADLAENAAFHSVIPLLLSIPLTILLTVWVVSRTMLPVKRLSQSLSVRQENDLSPLNDTDAPSEMTGFITAINRLLKRTDDNIRQQQRFIADAAHEMRSPMTALSLQVERLNQLPLADDAKLQARQIQTSIARQRHLLEQLLSLARAQSPDAKRPFAAVNLQQLFRRILEELHRILEELHPLAAAKGQDMGIAVERNCEIYANETEIYTLIKTLADNAIRYTPDSGQIDLGFDDNDTHLTLWVEDNGPGIPPEERRRVLDPFYRILGSEQQGTGLGLSIADTIAKRYGGKLILSDNRRTGHGLLAQVELDKQTLQK